MKIALPLMDSTNCLLSNNARIVGKCAGKLAVRDGRVAIILTALSHFSTRGKPARYNLATLDFLYTYLLSVSSCKTTLETVRFRGLEI